MWSWKVLVAVHHVRSSGGVWSGLGRGSCRGWGITKNWPAFDGRYLSLTGRAQQRWGWYYVHCIHCTVDQSYWQYHTLEVLAVSFRRQSLQIIGRFFLGGSLGSPWHTMTTYGLAGKGTDSSPSEYLRFAHREVPRHLRSRRGAWGDFVGLGGVWVNLGGIRLGSLDVFGRSFDWTCGILHPGFLWYAHIIPSLLQLHALHMKLLVEHNRPWLGMLGWHRTQHSPAVERPVQIRGVHFFGVTWKQIGRWRDLIWECLGEYTSRPQMDGHVWCWAFSTLDFFWGGADCLIVLRAQGWKIRYTSRSPSVSWTYRGWSRHRPSWNQWFVNQVRYLLWTNDACMVNFINILYQWFVNFYCQSPSFDLILDMVMENFASGHLYQIALALLMFGRFILADCADVLLVFVPPLICLDPFCFFLCERSIVEAFDDSCPHGSSDSLCAVRVYFQF